MIGFTKFLGFLVTVGIDANIVIHPHGCMFAHTHTHTFFGREGSIQPLDD